MNTLELQRLLSEYDDGILRNGAHEEGREFCALEFESKVRGREWSDAPVTLPDLRPLNDARWSSDAARTEALLPVMAALWDWTTWSEERRTDWATRVAIVTVNQIVAELPGLTDEVRAQCRAAKDIKAAAAEAVAAEAARAEAVAARAAAEAVAARAAAAAAEARAADSVLLIACRIWIDAAEATQ